MYSTHGVLKRPFKSLVNCLISRENVRQCGLTCGNVSKVQLLRLWKLWCLTWFLLDSFNKMRDIFASSMISQHQYGIGSWNSSLWETMNWVPYRIRTMVAKYLAKQGQYHDDVIKWKHCPRYWSFVRGIHRSAVNSPHKGQWRGAFFICAWINVWVNNCKAGDLRRHRAHFDVTVMTQIKSV